MEKNTQTKDIVQKQQFSCHYCSNKWWSQDRVVCNMKMCTEDEDSWKEKLEVPLLKSVIY